MPRIDSRECFSDGTEGKNKTDLLTNSKWQIGLFLWLKVARVQAKRSTNEGGKGWLSLPLQSARVPSLEPDCVRFPKFC